MKIFGRVFVAAVMAATFAAVGNAEAVVSGSASLTYSESRTTTATGTSTFKDFSEVYRLMVSKNITHTIDVMLSVNWAQFRTSSGGTSSSASSVYPMLTISFHPPTLYTFTFAHMRTETDPSEGIRILTTNTGASFITPSYRFISPVNLNYSMATQKDGEKVRRFDNDSERWGASTVYGFGVLGGNLGLNFSYGHNKETDNISKSYGESTSYSIGGGYTREFSKKYSLTLSSSMSHSESTLGSNTASRFDSQLTASSGLSCTGACGGSLFAEPALIDNNTAVQAGIVNIQNVWHMGIGFSVPESLHKMYLYVNASAAEEANIQSIYVFNWQIFYSNDNISWFPIALSSVIYNPVNNRFEFEFPETAALYFKILNGAGQGTNILVTEIAAFKFLLGTASTSATSSADSRTYGLSFSGRFTEKISASYSLSYSQNESSYSDNVYYSLSHGLHGSYVVHPQYMNLGASISLSESGTDTEKKIGETKSYNLSAGSRPLHTVTLSTNYSRVESYVLGDKMTVSDSFGLSSGLALYRGISLSLSASQGSSKALVSGSKSTSRALSDEWVFVPWNKVTLNVRHSQSWSDVSTSTGKTSSSADSLAAYVSYVPISQWAFSAAFNIRPDTSQSYNLSVVITHKIRANFGAAFAGGNKSYNSSVGMNLVPRTSLWCNYSRAESGGNTSDALSVSLNINL